MTGSGGLSDTQFLSFRRMLNFAHIVSSHCLGVLSTGSVKGSNAGTGKGSNAGTGKKDTR